MVIEHHGRAGARKKYKSPERKTAEQKIRIKLFCDVRGCNNYISGIEGYNGNYTDDDGTKADLRNVMWYCDKHSSSTRK